MRFLPLCILLCLALSCGSRTSYVGAYAADPGDTPKHTETTLELKENGVGIWKVGDDEVPFSWYMKGAELRVNTRGGGVIVGKAEKDVIHIKLPGSKEMAFKKIK